MFKQKLQIITLMAILLIGSVMTSQAQDTKDGEPIVKETSSDTNTTRDDDGDTDVPDCIIWDIDGASWYK